MLENDLCRVLLGWSVNTVHQAMANARQTPKVVFQYDFPFESWQVEAGKQEALSTILGTDLASWNIRSSNSSSLITKHDSTRVKIQNLSRTCRNSLTMITPFYNIVLFISCVFVSIPWFWYFQKFRSLSQIVWETFEYIGYVHFLGIIFWHT